MTTIAYGSKYAATKDMSRVEVAKLVRADIKAAVKAGSLPAWTYSVRCESYAGGGSINVKFSNVIGPILSRDAHALTKCGRGVECNAAHTPAMRINADGELVENPAGYRHSPEVRRVTKAIEAIVADYNYDGSDVQSDYFNVRFYSSVGIDWREEARDRESLIVELRSHASAALVDPEVLALARERVANDVAPPRSNRATYVPIPCIAMVGWE